MNASISVIDLSIIFLYILIVLFIGFYFRKKSKSSEEYFLAGRSIGWIAIGASLFATNISSEHFLGLAGTGSKSGLAVGHFEWLACLILLLLGWVFSPFYLKSRVFTMPEFVEKTVQHCITLLYKYYFHHRLCAYKNINCTLCRRYFT